MENNDNNVIVKDIDMPFKSMVIFGIKWMFAMIPALIIFYITSLLFLGIIGVVIFGVGTLF